MEPCESAGAPRRAAAGLSPSDADGPSQSSKERSHLERAEAQEVDAGTAELAGTSRRSSVRHTTPVSYAEPKGKSIPQYAGTSDDGIKHFLLYGGSQAAAARAVDCCPVALNRAIHALKQQDAWDDHIADIKAHHAPSPSKAAKPAKPALEMPTPTSLGIQRKSLGSKTLLMAWTCSRSQVWVHSRSII
uniref:Uncharacterized protein n=1 Tax=Prymnesium polylepis TaxID=72548 RepID=A0A6T7ZU73_9EUKA|mmetsp:Transcript_984/g.2519  ORF Transcript_984/g.2519 Transcript_984/m.2519 type:complete len:189 (+) Transcript_984:724-1290(+)